MGGHADQVAGIEGLSPKPTAAEERLRSATSLFLVSLRFTEIHYGEARAEDVALSPDNRSIQIKLVYGPVAKWDWKVTAYLVAQK
jgi:hypothetical protein